MSLHSEKLWNRSGKGILSTSEEYLSQQKGEWSCSIPLTENTNGYWRISPPNFADVAEIVDLASQTPLGHSVIVNCQLGQTIPSLNMMVELRCLFIGRGRSTMVSTMLTLFRHWLEAKGKQHVFSEAPQSPTKVLAYAVINNVSFLKGSIRNAGRTY